MSAARRHYVPRSPRYVFSANDESLMRFAPMSTRGTAIRAQVRDLSESGLSIALIDTETPEEGDMLKIEFSIPAANAKTSARQIACFATVVRVEIVKEWDPEWGDREFTLVALQFRNLPSPYQRALKQALQSRTGSHEKDEIDGDLSWVSENQTHAMGLGGTSIALAIAFYVLSLPPHVWIETIRKML